MAQDGSKSAQYVQDGPRWPQDGPKGPHKTPKEGSKRTPQEGLKRHKSMFAACAPNPTSPLGRE
eukprot:4176519-Pyramimonas_sp.AAC.1